MPDSTFELLTLAEASERLHLADHFGSHHYDHCDGERHRVRFYAGSARLEHNIDLDALLWSENVAGIWVEQDLTIDGTIFNWKIDTPASFLAIGRDLYCGNLVAGSADIRIRRDVIAVGVIVPTYNHGYLEVARNVRAKYLIIDDHSTVVRGNVLAGGWKDANNAEVALPDSCWLDEVRPEFTSEFFDEDGDMRCGNGNVDLVKALLASRDILR